jgi:protein involved in polysaccharide export with SLBB domain
MRGSLPHLGKALKRSFCWVLALSMITQAFPVLAMADPAPMAVTNPAQSDYPPFLIGPGDMLSVTVYGEKDLPDKYLVDSSGTIVFPLVGEIKLGA